MVSFLIVFHRTPTEELCYASPLAPMTLRRFIATGLPSTTGFGLFLCYRVLNGEKRVFAMVINGIDTEVTESLFGQASSAQRADDEFAT